MRRAASWWVLAALIVGACASDPEVASPVGSTGAIDDDDDGTPASTTAASTSGGGEASASAGTEPASTDADPTGDDVSTTDDAADTTAADDASTDDGDTGTPTDTRGFGTCGELEACCEAIGADLYAGCIAVVDMGNVDLCDSILATYHGEGYCTGEPYCDELGDCCPELPPGPGWQDTCWYYADFGNQPQCLMLIGDYQLSGYCQ